jgi:hypothetical protein
MTRRHIDSYLYNKIINKKVPYTRLTVEEIILENKELRIFIKKLEKELIYLRRWKKDLERKREYQKERRQRKDATK